MINPFLITLIALFMMPSTDGVPKFTKLGITHVIYEFEDSSVPPPHHRSYQISLSAEKLHIVVDSYGDIIADKEFPATQEQLDGVLELLEKSKIKSGKKKESKGCTGGTGERIRCKNADAVVFSGYVYHCGGADYGDMSGETANIKSFVIGLVPDFEKLLDRN